MAVLRQANSRMDEVMSNIPWFSLLPGDPRVHDLGRGEKAAKKLASDYRAGKRKERFRYRQ